MSSVNFSRNVSFAVFVISFILFVIAFSTPSWVGTKRTSHGPWKKCWDGFFLGGCTSIGDVDDSKLSTTRAMMCLSLICQIVSAVTYVVWLYRPTAQLREHGAGTPGITALSLVLVAGFFNLVAVAVYGSYDAGDKFSWSFWMACSSTVLIVLNGSITLALTHCCCRGSTASPSVTTGLQSSTAANVSPHPQQPIGMFHVSNNGQVVFSPVAATHQVQHHGAYPAQQYYQPQGLPLQQQAIAFEPQLAKQ